MVHVEAGAHPAQAVAETAWLQGMADQIGWPTGIVAHAALESPDLDDTLAAHAAHPRVRGVRHIVNWHPDPARSYTPRDVTRDEAWRRGFGQLARYGLSFDCQAYPGQFPALADLFARHPETPVMINHAGMGVDLDAAGQAEWRRGMTLLAALPHVSVKVSGLGFAWRTPDAVAMRDRVSACLDLFGADRAMMASDFPTDRLFGSFDDTLDRLAQAAAGATPAERRALFAGNANRLYRLGLEF
jgi:predicted TIM-barrel fold metal-dependent hydrolase